VRGQREDLEESKMRVKVSDADTFGLTLGTVASRSALLNNKTISTQALVADIVQLKCLPLMQ